MASSKPKTTMNKLIRERKVRERRLDKQARKIARMNASDDPQAQEDRFRDRINDPEAMTASDEANEVVQAPAES